MVSLRSLFAAGALCLSAANAHFELRQPPSLEGDNMNEDLEPNAPCGGGVADLSTNKVVDFHVDGDAVAWFLGHPQAKWLIRGTLDSKAAGNWTEMYPIIQQDGRGEYCQPAVTAPKAWAGKKGIISVACGAPDGLLFQCAAVNFVSGANTSPSPCNNGSVNANFSEDPNLTALLDASTTTSPGPPESTSGSAAPSLILPGSGLSIGGLAVTAVMLLVGAAVL
ncbi:hypothetical protein CHGG_03666 [Chaetomium globosum CBS 148.51]|uniref:Copper acquisition factor BIM1-like domain-containing protein n=1 Tax=Chaetomium globosum (strain ATCC 6205 / CBS 148.51 / DSM 1962 / NBRC 6347 / NRRL 1970) TaxID=306901 RepID=Q2H7Y8_CHAGB|nr:uncharacterized protein CHGG_03666 [Chaetomium globosum CBS 148.51]EAQ91731.1 hypothetical protein CHGG_03666 [Chaetomium globosum CBS 148.51]